MAASTACAAGNGSFKFASNAPQFAHALLNVGKVMAGQLVDVAARQSRIVGQCEQTANLLQAEPEFAPSRDESQPIHLLLPVSAIPARGPGRVWQEPHSLVVPDRLDVAATGSRRFADLHGLTL